MKLLTAILVLLATVAFADKKDPSSIALGDKKDPTFDESKPTELVINDKGEKVVMFQGEERSREGFGVDLDGDKIEEDMAFRLDAKPGAMHEIQVKVLDDYPIDDAITVAIKEAVGKKGTVTAHTTHGLNHFIISATAGSVHKVAELPFVEVIMTNEGVYRPNEDQREITGVNFAANTAVGIGQAGGLENPASRINGDRDGNVNFHSTNDVVIAHTITHNSPPPESPARTGAPWRNP